MIGEASAKGRGIGKEISELLLDYSFTNLNLNSLWLTVRTDNVPGVRLFRSLGFEVEAPLHAAAITDGIPVYKFRMTLTSERWSSR